MRLTPENKRKITERIRGAAARTFRENGYDAVNLDRLMQESGLTRGAFYAHYRSKAALFADVMRHEHPLLRMLEDRAKDRAQSYDHSDKAKHAGHSILYRVDNSDGRQSQRKPSRQ